MGLGVGIVLRQDLFVRRGRLVKLALPPETVSPVKKLKLALVLRFGDGGGAPAVFADAAGGARNKIDVPAAQLTFNDRHPLHTPYIRSFVKLLLKDFYSLQVGCQRPYNL